MIPFSSLVLRNLDHLTNPSDTVLVLYTDVIVLREPDKQERAGTLADLVRQFHAEGGSYIPRKIRELPHQ